MLAGLLIQIRIASAQNLATNPGFETDNTTGWSSFGAGLISVESNYVHSGNFACLVTNRTATWNGIGQSLLGVLQTNQTYNISVWLRLAGGADQIMALTLEKSDANGTFYNWLTSGTVSTNGWVQFAGQYTLAPTGTVTSLFLYAEVPSSQNAAYYIDDLDVQPVSTPNHTNGQCTVAWTNVFQPIDGFGASSAWHGSWTTNQADMFFSTNSGTGTTEDGRTNFAFNGIGLSLLRNSFGSDGTTVETGIMQMAQARGARVWSTPWSPPVIYKNTNSENGGSFVSSPANFQGYANLLAGYVAAMKSNYGVNLYAVSIQNEPDISTFYGSCLWTAQQIHDFVPYLAAALTNAGVASTRIMLPEDSNWNYNYSLATTAMTDPATAAQVGIVAAHDYGGSHSVITNYGKPLWETEVSTFDPYDGSMTNGLYWARQIHDMLTIDQVNAWHFWWLIPYPTDNESLVDTNGLPAKRMYVLGQYSRFVRPGYYRIGAANVGTTSISAYKDPASGNFALVAINTNAADFTQTFNLAGFNCVRVSPWITSAILSLASQPAINLTNASFTCTLPAASVVTFVGQAIATNATTLAGRLIGKNLILSWPADHTGWTLLSQTNNLNKGVSANTNDWVRLPSSATTNQAVIPMSSTQAGGYFRLTYP